MTRTRAFLGFALQLTMVSALLLSSPPAAADLGTYRSTPCGYLGQGRVCYVDGRWKGVCSWRKRSNPKRKGALYCRVGDGPPSTVAATPSADAGSGCATHHQGEPITAGVVVVLLSGLAAAHLLRRRRRCASGDTCPWQRDSASGCDSPPTRHNRRR